MEQFCLGICFSLKMLKMISKLECLFRCQKEFRVTKGLLSDPNSIKSSENLQRIANAAMLFGELLCSMKVGIFYFHLDFSLYYNLLHLEH